MTGSPPLSYGFILLSLVLAVGFLASLNRIEGARSVQVGAVAWLVVTALAATRGVWRFDTLPPTMLILLAVSFGLTIWIGLSEVGNRLARLLPLWLLVGYQGFRIVVELLMHRAYGEGIMPVQMSFEGLNFDIVSGITALILGLAIMVWRVPRRVVLAWNYLGLALLANILTIALLSAPTPLRAFTNEPPNVWVTEFPYVWLPAVLVPLALLGHILVFRRLAVASGG